MRRLNDESGAMVVFVGVLMMFFMLLVALVVDTGRLYDERRQLQNGADAAALAVAFDCARDESTCAATAQAHADQYANANAVDDLSAIDPTSPLAFNPLIDLGAQRVTVDTRSQEPGQSAADGAMHFVIEWPDGRDSQAVRARAVAQWGPAASAETVPLVISYCDFDRGQVAGETVITFHDPDAESSDSPGNSGGGGGPPGRPPEDGDDGDDGQEPCDGHPGFDRYDGSEPLPAGFGALQTSTACQAHTVASGEAGAIEVWAFQDPGADFNQLRGCLEVGRTIPIPVFVDFCRKGDCPPGVDPQQAAYRIGGYTMFEVSGWRFPGDRTNPAPCDASQSCIAGKFTTGVIPDAEMGTGPDFGARAARLVR